MIGDVHRNQDAVNRRYQNKFKEQQEEIAILKKDILLKESQIAAVVIQIAEIKEMLILLKEKRGL